MFQARLEQAFARGDFADVRRLAAQARDEHERELAARYVARTAPPPAVRFALGLTLALVLVLSTFFAFLRHP